MKKIKIHLHIPSKSRYSRSLHEKLLTTWLLCAVVAFSSIAAPAAYNRYLMGSVGARVVKLMSPTMTNGGTGFVVNTQAGTRMLTNAHICELAVDGELIASYEDGKIEPVKVIKVAENGVDLCLVTAPVMMDGLNLGSAPQFQDQVFILGHPLLESLQIAGGVLIELRQIFVIGKDGPVRAISTTVNIAPGSSGSPVVNVWGNLVGVAFAYSPETKHALIVPFKDVVAFLNKAI